MTTVKQNKQWKWTGSEDEQGKGTTRVCRGTNDRKEEEKGTTWCRSARAKAVRWAVGWARVVDN